MITLRWAPFPEADVASYKVFRSMIGFRAPVVPLNGKTLQLKLNGGSTQTFTFGTGSPVDLINATITGGQAYLSDDEDFFFVRSDVREAPGSIQIVGGTSLVDLGLTAHTITEQSEDELIATVPALVDPNELVEYEDPDGVLQDFYAIQTVDTLNNESLKTAYKQPVSSTGAVCVLEGIVVDLQGVRIPDVEVKASLVNFPHSPGTASNITLEPITTLTGTDGRFSLALLQGALVQLEIPAIRFSKNITVPEEAFAFITDLQVDLDYRYPLGFSGVV